ncbi:hypothetical protein MPER_10206 [Moniliophthora perniciosa FA553]|nr:hypothetical protein MPER_10206 [Moniliophthora perniciosa FA553]
MRHEAETGTSEGPEILPMDGKDCFARAGDPAVWGFVELDSFLSFHLLLLAPGFNAAHIKAIQTQYVVDRDNMLETGETVLVQATQTNTKTSEDVHKSKC